MRRASWLPARRRAGSSDARRHSDSDLPCVHTPGLAAGRGRQRFGARADAWASASSQRKLRARGHPVRDRRHCLRPLRHRRRGPPPDGRGLRQPGSPDERGRRRSEDDDDEDEAGRRRRSRRPDRGTSGVGARRRPRPLRCPARHRRAQPPPDPDPFDPLPVCSPGMLQDDDGLPAREAPAGYPAGPSAPRHPGGRPRPPMGRRRPDGGRVRAGRRGATRTTGSRRPRASSAATFATGSAATASSGT